MCCKCCTRKQQKIWLFTLGTIFTIIGIILISAWPTFAESIIRAKLVLTPTSFSFENWQTTPITLYMTFYLFNWTNPHEVNNPNVKPHFTEHGPYAFKDFKVKEDLVWNDENSTVTFYGRRTWNFDPEKSNGSLDDVIITPNFPVMGASKISRNMHKVLRKIANFGINREGGALTYKATALEWIFDGFYDDLFDFVERLHSPILPIYSNKFAWFYERNNSKEAEGTYTIHTGKKDLSKLGDLMLWNGSDHTGFWEGECGKVNGSAGDLWSPYKSWDESISIFIKDAARYINLFPKEKVTYRRGVKAWLYESTDQTFDSGHIAPDTKCFCVNDVCPKNGAIDYSPVTFRAPVYISHPHFYMADESYLANTTGLNPDSARHKIQAVIEPTLGVPLNVTGQVMISILVEQDDHMDLLKDVAHNFYAPLFSLQMKGEITDELIDELKLALIASDLGQYTGIGLTVVGVILLAVGVWLTVGNKTNKEDVEKENAKHEQSKSIEKNATTTESQNSEAPDAKRIQELDSKNSEQNNELEISEITQIPETATNNEINAISSIKDDLK